MVFELSIIILLSFALRSLFILGRSSDQYYHYNNIRRVVSDGMGFSNRSDSLIEGKQIYPPLPHYIIALFPERLWNLAGRLLNILYDIVVVVLIYLAGLYYIKDIRLPVGEYAGLSPAGWVALLFSTCPLLFPVSARLKAIGGRTMGLLFSTIYFVCLAGFYIHGSALFFAAGVMAGIMTLISSNFSSQAMVLISLMLSFFLGSYVPLIAVASVIIISLLMKPLGVGTLMKENWCHYRWYWRNIEGVSSVRERNRMSSFFRLPADVFRNPANAARLLFERNSYVIALLSLPVIVPLLMLSMGGMGLGGSLQERFCWAMLYSGIIIFVLTSIRPLTIFGQAERYLENIAPYVVALFVTVVLRKGIEKVFLPMLLWNIILVLSNFIYIMKKDYIGQLRTEPPADIVGVIETVRSFAAPRILTIPTKLAYLVAAFADHPGAGFYYDWILEGNKGYRYMTEERSNYQFPRQDLDYFKDRYGINTLIILKSALEKAAALKIDYDLSGFQRMFENDKYMVVKV